MIKKITEVGVFDDIWKPNINDRQDFSLGVVSLPDTSIKGWDLALAQTQFAQSVKKIETKPNNSYNPYEKVAQEVTAVLKEVREEFPAIEKMMMDGQLPPHFDFSEVSGIAKEMVIRLKAALEDIQELAGEDFASVQEASKTRDINATIEIDTEEALADPMKQGLNAVLGFMNNGQLVLNDLNEFLTKDRGNEMVSLKDMVKISAGMTHASMSINLAVATTKQVIDTIKGVMNTPL